LRLAEQELIDRDGRMVDRRIKAAKFPAVKTLDSFRFAALPSLNKALVMELACSVYGKRTVLVPRIPRSELRIGGITQQPWM
jgi:DNA replication protein DnaC